MQKALNNNELSSLARQLSMLLHSGISVLESVSILLKGAGLFAERSHLLEIVRKPSGLLHRFCKFSGLFKTFIESAKNLLSI